MSSQEVIDLKQMNDHLAKKCQRLTEAMALMDRFRVLLIAMVNNCKCSSETTIRVRFNLLMEDYYQLQEVEECDQTYHQIEIDDLLDKPVIQTEDNTDFDTNSDKLEEIIPEIDILNDERREDKQRLFEAITKTDEGTDLELRERVARLKKYVARPKMYSRANKARVRSDQSFECSWPGCESVFKAKVDLKTHLAFRHMGEKPYRCDWPGCEKQFPVKRNLARHRETHEGVKHYACDWPGCEYKSWYPQGVRAHRKRHTDERPHRCQWPSCEWTFRQSHHLKAHMLKHTGEKPFACSHPGCDQRFQSRQAMRFHCDRAHQKT